TLAPCSRAVSAAAMAAFPAPTTIASQSLATVLLHLDAGRVDHIAVLCDLGCDVLAQLLRSRLRWLDALIVETPHHVRLLQHDAHRLAQPARGAGWKSGRRQQAPRLGHDEVRIAGLDHRRGARQLR